MTEIPTVAPSPVENDAFVEGADLDEIRYTLPANWEAKLDEDSLFISPKEEGGFFSIEVFDYPKDIGRRAYFCTLHDWCEQANPYYEIVKIGNITGYEAFALDASGSGPPYFGVKGSKFYIIHTFSPPPPNEFAEDRQSVLDSLVF